MSQNPHHVESLTVRQGRMAPWKAGPGLAQTAAGAEAGASEEVCCVHEGLLGLADQDLVNIMRAVVTETSEGDFYDALELLIADAALSCIMQHDGNVDQADAAITIGVTSVVPLQLEACFRDRVSHRRLLIAFWISSARCRRT